MRAGHLGLYAGISILQFSIGLGCAGSGENEAQDDAARVASALTTSHPAANIARTVTLITGDRVVVGGGNNIQAASILPASGRSRVRFFTQRVAPGPGQGRHLYVLPEDALPMIAAGKVDSRLFDVTLLLEFQYDDAHRSDLPLIVTYAQSSTPLGASNSRQLAASPRALNGTVGGTTLPSVNGMSTRAPKARAQEVWSDIASQPAAASARTLAVASAPIGKVWLDGLLQPVLDHSVPQIGAPAAWALGFEGDGVLVAVLDTGIDDSHPDLADRVVGRRNFTPEDDVDVVGHGTHVASIIAGSGAASAGRYRGVAPGAQLLSGKVCEIYGCMESSIIAGMEWAAIEEGAQVVNLSLGGTDEPGLDPLEEAVNRLTVDYGTLFVIAAGNEGPEAQTVSSPGSAEQALTVGAVDRDDEVAWFSGRGLTVGDSAIKPDIAGPGVDIVAARAAGTELGMPVDENYVTLSGTSMATPHVVGAAALLLQQHPEWGPAETKAALMGSAAYNPDWTVPDQGAGRVDVEAALDTSVVAETPSVSFGLAPWPHDDDEPVTRTVSYRSLGSAAQLTLELDIVGPGGIRPPAGMFTVTPASLTLPAGGTVSVTVTANTSVEVPDGVYSGRLIATDEANRALSVPLAVNREEESYNLTLRQLDRSGAPTTLWLGFIVGLDRSTFRFISADADGDDLVFHLPKGRYAVETMVFESTFTGPVTRNVAANQQLTSDRLLVMDARLGLPISVSPPKPGIEGLSVDETWGVETECCGIESSFTTGPSDGIAFYQAEIGASSPDLYSILSAQWLDSTSTPAAFYAAAWSEQGKLPAGPVKRMDLRKAAVVHERYATPASAKDAPQLPNVALGVGAYGGERFSGVLASLWPVALPLERTEYFYSDDKDTRWWKTFMAFDDEYTTFADFDGGMANYRARQRYSAQWSQAPFAPLSPDTDSASWLAFASRHGDQLIVVWPMYSDRGGHTAYIPSEGRTALYADGELVGESPDGSGGLFEVPPDPAEYRLELSYSQSMFELTTHQDVVWTFASGHVDEGEQEHLPLLVLQLSPELNEVGAAPRGRFRVPLSVKQYGRQGTVAVREPSVAVSYDDGAHWTKAKVERSGQTWNVILDHPRSADYVSLRASAKDRAGNSVKQTLIRAYALTGSHGHHGGGSK